MLNTQDICAKFGSLLEYEAFHKEWARACYRLNPTEKNRKELEDSKKSSAVLGAKG